MIMRIPRSIDCIKPHINEARQLLKLEIGTTFVVKSLMTQDNMFQSLRYCRPKQNLNF